MFVQNEDFHSLRLQVTVNMGNLNFKNLDYRNDWQVKKHVAKCCICIAIWTAFLFRKLFLKIYIKNNLLWLSGRVLCKFCFEAGKFYRLLLRTSHGPLECLKSKEYDQKFPRNCPGWLRTWIEDNDGRNAHDFLLHHVDSTERRHKFVQKSFHEAIVQMTVCNLF